MSQEIERNDSEDEGISERSLQEGEELVRVFKLRPDKDWRLLSFAEKCNNWK